MVHKHYRQTDDSWMGSSIYSSLINCKLEAKDVLTNTNRTQAAERAEKCRFCPWWPWPSNSSEGGTKRVFRVNLVQIRSAVPKIFHTQTKKIQTDSARNRTFRSSLSSNNLPRLHPQRPSHKSRPMSSPHVQNTRHRNDNCREVCHWKYECEADELLVLFSSGRFMLVPIQPLPHWLTSILLRLLQTCYMIDCFHRRRIMPARNGCLIIVSKSTDCIPELLAEKQIRLTHMYYFRS